MHTVKELLKVKNAFDQSKLIICRKQDDYTDVLNDV